MDAPAVERAPRADHPDIRRIFVETFSGEPSFAYMLPDARTRRAHVAWLVDKKLRLHGDKYVTHVTAGAIRGFSWWLEPGANAAASLLGQLRAGFWRAPLRFGPRSFARMVRFSAQESAILRAATREPHWVLDVIATDPRAQRTGLGGALMEPVFQRSFETRVPCFVLTHNARNVGFYEKYGFRLTIDDPTAPGVRAYGLVRPARP